MRYTDQKQQDQTSSTAKGSSQTVDKSGAVFGEAVAVDWTTTPVMCSMRSSLLSRKSYSPNGYCRGRCGGRCETGYWYVIVGSTGAFWTTSCQIHLETQQYPHAWQWLHIGALGMHPICNLLISLWQTSPERWSKVDLWRKREAYITLARKLLGQQMDYRQWDCFSFDDFMFRKRCGMVFVKRHFPLSDGDDQHNSSPPMIFTRLMVVLALPKTLFKYL